MIYFIEAVGLDHIKIGRIRGNDTDGIQQRLCAFQCGNSYPLRVLGTHKGYLEEGTYHKRLFPSIKVRGEWFRATAKLLEFISKKTKQYNSIKLIDDMLGEKLTSESIRNVQYDTSLFGWHVESSSLSINPACKFLGWYEGERRSRYRPTICLFFAKDGEIYQCSGQFFNANFKKYFLPRFVRDKFKPLSLVDGALDLSGFSYNWTEIMDELLTEELRIYL